MYPPYTGGMGKGSWGRLRGGWLRLQSDGWVGRVRSVQALGGPGSLAPRSPPPGEGRQVRGHRRRAGSRGAGATMP